MKRAWPRAAAAVLLAAGGCREPVRWEPAPVAEARGRPAGLLQEQCRARAAGMPAVRLRVARGTEVAWPELLRAVGLVRAVLGPVLEDIEVTRAPVELPPLSGKPGQDIAWRRLGELVRSHGARGTVLLLLVARLTAPGSAADRALGGPKGLGLGPRSREDPRLAGLRDLLPRAMSGVALVSVRALGRMEDARAAALLGHEIGHAVGLAHSSTAGRLMATRGGCGREPRGPHQ